MDDLETIGLAAEGRLLIKDDDLNALLSGRRSSLLRLENLKDDRIRIAAMEAKVSLRVNEQGKPGLLIHPVYHKPSTPDFLEDDEAELLEKGEVANLQKVVSDGMGGKKELLVEYDPETREFIVSDTDLVQAPDMVNNERLTPAQKERYRKGKEVEIEDHTKFSYSAVDKHGMRANKMALIASILMDAGMSYVLYKGLNALFNRKRDPEDSAKLSPGYHQAFEYFQADNPVKDNRHIQVDAKRRSFR
ncbi:DUF3945 domain-containing protein [Mucilaginibacter sp. SMC90]|uniref:DUF4099 domain-containing protein n=1 Tax=Mucilaginibacter sp. SMC90 TaxID=2929803 RepID=UPI001FB3B43A|nr:DUF4099 domain-containing protein [Mucilaginibacter sp. SMC90]UOE50926.1 DUF3945 domain-containing protein [Mucilaginibacter sp. SMC90]